MSCYIVATVDSGGNMGCYIVAATRSGVDNRMFLRKTVVRGVTIARF